MKHQFEYPIAHVFIYYQLLANFIHAVLSSLLNYGLFKHYRDVPLVVFIIDNMMLFFVPFFCCAMYFIYKKYKIDDKNSLYHIAIFSALIYIVYNVIFVIILSLKNQFHMPKVWIFAIGLISFVVVSTFCARIILPKTEHYLKNKYKREKMVARQNKNKEVVVSNQHLENKVVVSYQYLEQALKNVGVLRENHENKAKYPRLMVFLVYSQFGGSIGAFLTIIGGFVYFFFEEYNSVFFQDVGLLIFILSYIVVGFIFFLFAGIVGAIPAILTGAYIALSKIYLRNIWSYLHIFMVGYLSSLLIFREWWLGLVGGISSVIVGYVIVPKSENDCSEDW